MIDSLRARLSFWYLCILGLSLCLFSLFIYAFLSADLQRHHDEHLVEDAAAIQDALRDIPLSANTVETALAELSILTPYVLVLDEDRAIAYRSALLAQTKRAAQNVEQAMRDAIDARQSSRRQGQVPLAETFLTTVPVGPERIRVLCCVSVGLQNAGTLHLGNGLGDLSTTLRSIGVVSMVLCLPLVLLLTSFGGWVIATRALKPMRAIQADLEAIQASDLSKRVTVRPFDEELSGLVAAVNGLLERLERAFDDLRHFTADISHQLQTPLTVMKGTLELAVARGHDRDHQSFQKALTDLHDEVEHMSRTISGLRDLTLVDAETPGADVTDLSAVCRQAVEIIDVLAEAASLMLDSTIADDIAVRGDRVRLKQVILNLCENAIKYTPAGGTVRVCLSSHDGHTAVVTVTDSGEGIAPDILPNVFDRFFRGDSAETTAGMGLGLAIVKRIVEAHHGQIRVHSAPGQGATFEVRLPLVRTGPS